MAKKNGMTTALVVGVAAVAGWFLLKGKTTPPGGGNDPGDANVHVTDQATGQPISGVLIAAGSIQATTDSLGNAILKGLAIGQQYTITLWAPGRNPQSFSMGIMPTVAHWNISLV
jgi:hypothetical protein